MVERPSQQVNAVYFLEGLSTDSIRAASHCAVSLSLMVFLMDWSTLTDGRVHSSDPSSEGADYFGWLLAVTGIGRTE